MKNFTKILSAVLVAAAVVLIMGACSSKDAAGDYSGENSGSGQGGSMARFTIVGDFLYTVDDRDLNVFSIETPSKPKREGKPQNVGWGIETIYPFKDYLFIGSSNAMYIYNIDIPYEPTYVSRAPHFINRDPVVVIDGYAYVTLSDDFGSAAGNVLIIYDISNFNRPVEVKRMNFNRPRGLGVDETEKKLFICDDTIVKVYDITDPETPVRIGDSRAVTGWRFDAYDVIVQTDKQHLLVIGSDGFYQFDYGQGDDLVKLGSIQVERETIKP